MPATTALVSAIHPPSHTLALLITMMTLSVLWAPPSRSFSFSEGNYYTSTIDSFDIAQNDESGERVATMVVELQEQLPGALQIKDIAFGQDRLLYAVVDLGVGYAVAALDEGGNVREIYSQPVGAIGQRSFYGKIIFDALGRFLVNDALGVTRFEVGAPNSRRRVWNRRTSALEVMASGNLLVSDTSVIREIDEGGQIVRRITASDPNEVGPGELFELRDVRGIVEEPNTGDLLVSDANGNQVVRLSADGILLARTQLGGIDDLQLAVDGSLLMGSLVQSPPRYRASDLTFLGILDGGIRLFITQLSRPPLAPPGARIVGIDSRQVSCTNASSGETVTGVLPNVAGDEAFSCDDLELTGEIGDSLILQASGVAFSETTFVVATQGLSQVTVVCQNSTTDERVFAFESDGRFDCVLGGLTVGGADAVAVRIEGVAAEPFGRRP